MYCELDVNDWKSCVRQKRTEGSNPSLSAKNPVSLMTYGVFAWGDFKGLMGAFGPYNRGKLAVMVTNYVNPNISSLAFPVP